MGLVTMFLKKNESLIAYLPWS